MTGTARNGVCIVNNQMAEIPAGDMLQLGSGGTGVSVSSFAALLAAIGAQAALGFPPVQQGTGVGQTSNAVKIGHSASGPKITIDNADFGRLHCDGMSVQAGSNFVVIPLPGNYLLQCFPVSTNTASGGTVVSLPTFFASSCLGGVVNDTGGSDYTWSLQNNGTGSVVVFAKTSGGSLVSGAAGFAFVIGK